MYMSNTSFKIIIKYLTYCDVITNILKHKARQKYNKTMVSNVL